MLASRDSFSVYGVLGNNTPETVVKCSGNKCPLSTVVVGILIVSSLLNFSFTLTKLKIAYRHYMSEQVALGDFEVIGVSELGDLIEYSSIAPLELAGRVLARTNN